MPVSTGTYTVNEHFEKRLPEVRATYDEIVKAVKKLGAIREEAKKTSIHLVRKTAFAGIATRKTALILTIKSASDIEDNRVIKREQVSANRWHLEFRMTKPQDVDKEIVSWLRNAYELSA